MFLKDVLECARSRPAIERVLGYLGLPLDAPQFHPARPPPQIELSLGGDTAGFHPDPPAPDNFAA